MNFMRNSLKKSFLEILRVGIHLKITKNNSQGIIFVTISCQRVSPNYTGHLLKTGLSGRNSFVQFGRLHKVLSVHVPITQNSCVGIDFLIARTHLLHKELLQIIYVIVSGPMVCAPESTRQ